MNERGVVLMLKGANPWSDEGFWFMEELLITACFDCNEVDPDDPRALLGTLEFPDLTGRVCPECGGRDTGVVPGIRRSISTLMDTGFKFNNIVFTVNQLQEPDPTTGIQCAQWIIAVNFDKHYPSEMFKNFPRKYFEIELKEASLHSVMYVKHTPLSELQFDEDGNIIEDSLWDKADEIFKDLDERLLRWANRTKKLGHTAVWQLAGYFD